MGKIIDDKTPDFDTQISQIYQYMREHSEGITQMKAYEICFATRLSAIIFELKHRHNIVILDKWEYKYRSNGKVAKKWKVYFLPAFKGVNANDKK